MRYFVLVFIVFLFVIYWS